MTHWVLHVDLDQFLAAVEVLRRPELRGRPVVVGGDGDPTKRGVVSTASYEARVFGVHSGLPLRTAARRCPDAVFLPVDKPVYEQVSATVMAALRELGGTVEILGWDEAFVGVRTDDPTSWARRIQEHVRASTQLDCTVGIGQNKLQAKIATGFGKPAGIYQLTSDSWYKVLGDRPTSALWGVGAKTERKLSGMGITTVAELAHADPELLATAFGPASGPWLAQLASGRASARVVDTPRVPRSRGREVTFQQDLEDWESVREQVVTLARTVATDVAAAGIPATRVVVKVRFAPFYTLTRSRVLETATTDGDAIEQAALTALERITDRRAVRLLGVRAELARDPEQGH